MQTAAHPGRDDQQAKCHPGPTGKFVRKNSPSVDHSYEGVNGLLTFVIFVTFVRPIRVLNDQSVVTNVGVAPSSTRLFEGVGLFRAIRCDRLKSAQTDAVAVGHPVQVTFGLHLVPVVDTGHERVDVCQSEGICSKRLCRGDFSLQAARAI